MLAIDIVKEPARDSLEDFARWLNVMQSRMLTDFHLGKSIEVDYIESSQPLGTTDGSTYRLSPLHDACDCSACTIGQFTDRH